MKINIKKLKDWEGINDKDKEVDRETQEDK